MTRKDEFLRAIQLEPFQGTYDLPLAFGLALNLAEKCVPPDLPFGAREFVDCISSSRRMDANPATDEKEPG